jgi:hypothetical protein
LGAIIPSATVAKLRAESVRLAFSQDREHRAHRAGPASPSLGRARRVIDTARPGSRESAAPSGARYPATDCALSAFESWERTVAHIGVTEHPTAEWTAQRVIEAIAIERLWRGVSTPRGRSRRARAHHAARAPTANAYCPRIIGTMRRDCLHCHSRAALMRRALGCPWYSPRVICQVARD